MLINHKNNIIKSSRCETWNITANKCAEMNTFGMDKVFIYVSWLHIHINTYNIHPLLDYILYGLHGSHGSHILIFSCYFTGLTLCSMSTIHQYYLLTMIISCFLGRQLLPSISYDSSSSCFDGNFKTFFSSYQLIFFIYQLHFSNINSLWVYDSF